MRRSSALGLSVTLVDTRADLLPFVDREIAGLLRQELGRLGVVFVANDHYARVERIAGTPPTVRVATRNGNVLEADVLLYCAGRDGNSRGLGLDAIGITPMRADCSRSTRDSRPCTLTSTRSAT